ncbi:GNAT family N-acetyltransferase [Virgibacillus soli]|uniref:GNAT family N-acetyltransferase n=1 Tax=Paracerasibacillus soli TaxID=480284 RepID=A0ABU5CUQ6_9BACI|nr:GNAT family N-acetyltransferase [Virgibacillus soli]MDY0409148.1 GNAT family N-acetyltransferase [Virgibacillus soli]
MFKFIPLEKSRLEGLLSLWEKEMGVDFPMRQSLFEQNSFDDENICKKSSCLAMDSNDQLVGFIIAKRWQETMDVPMNPKTGWIQVLVVDSDFRNQGIGSRLLQHAETTLRAAGVEQIWLGKDTYHYFPGIPMQYEETMRWFEKKGYQYQTTEYDLIRHYQVDEGTALPTIENVSFSLLNAQEKDELLHFLKRCFPGRWEYEAKHYFQKGGTGREFVIAKKAGKIIGFCRINDAKSPFIAQNMYWSPLFTQSMGGAGPLGIDANERGHGYGLAIVEAGLAFLRRRGINTIVIDWTGLVDFYKKLGYDIWKSYRTYIKEFEK